MSKEARNFSRAIKSAQEGPEAADWYDQRAQAAGDTFSLMEAATASG